MLPDHPTSATPPDTLLELELRIARRADELTREKMPPGALNLQCWLVAEYEVLGRGETRAAEKQTAAPGAKPAGAAAELKR